MITEARNNKQTHNFPVTMQLTNANNNNNSHKNNHDDEERTWIWG